MAGKPFFIFDHVEGKLRKADRLQPDDRLVELLVGTLLYTAYDGTAHLAHPGWPSKPSAVPTRRVACSSAARAASLPTWRMSRTWRRAG